MGLGYAAGKEHVRRSKESPEGGVRPGQVIDAHMSVIDACRYGGDGQGAAAGVDEVGDGGMKKKERMDSVAARYKCSKSAHTLQHGPSTLHDAISQGLLAETRALAKTDHGTRAG